MYIYIYLVCEYFFRVLGLVPLLPQVFDGKDDKECFEKDPKGIMLVRSQDIHACNVETWNGMVKVPPICQGVIEGRRCPGHELLLHLFLDEIGKDHGCGCCSCCGVW